MDFEHLNATLWVGDTVDGNYIEVGYGALYQRYGANWFYWANTYNGGITQNIFDIAPVPAADLGTYADIKITRNRQGAGKAQVAVVTVSGLNWSTVAYNIMGDSTYLGNVYHEGLELRTLNSSLQSTQGWLDWRNNRWQRNDGVYVYQSSIGNGPLAYPEPDMQAYWDVSPIHDPYGGIFATYCACD